MLFLFVASALASSRVAIVPGCPSNEDGTVSTCQWRRAIWAADLYKEGRVDAIITSGAAAYNPYVEADALAAALEEQGVPADRIVREPQALHTDENIAYSLKLVERHGFEEILVASDMLQAGPACKMVTAWTGRDCTPLTVNYKTVMARIKAGMPSVQIEPVSAWIPLEEREAQIAAARGEPPRKSSWAVYLRGMFAPKRSKPPELPPEG